MSDKELLIPASQMDSSAINAQTRRGRLQMLFLLLACAAPVIASYLAYYVFKPEGGKTNFGTLVQPVQDMNPAWFDIPFNGKWTLLVARPAGECTIKNESCLEALFLMRQLRIAVGRESGRVQLVWVNTDGKPVDPEVLLAYDQKTAGFQILSLPADTQLKAEFDAWLNRDGAGQKIQLIDPRIMKLARSLDGVISGEHGIGITKLEYLTED
ncbi:FAD-linked oxidase C-terminal domain-containing protein, partial [Polynucleobacter sp. 39-46-10]|uniref:FAD-linked oxidase C-terminal domain-containing protein n=1 Tax=Polynucleobacter sp. 39-46-10 TaxID=1970428 RepID=UPI0026008A3C